MATRQTAAAATTLALLLLAATAHSSAAMTSRKLLHAADPYFFCPWDAVKFGACVGVLDAVVGLQAGAHRLGSNKCCQIAGGLAAAEAAACFCATIKEAVLGIPTEWTVGVSVLASACKTELPDGFKCV